MTTRTQVQYTGSEKWRLAALSAPYWKLLSDTTQAPNVSLIQARIPDDALSTELDEAHPVDRRMNATGLKGLWRPWGRGFGLGGLAINSGYEYRTMDRKFAEYDPDFNELNTTTNSFQIGPSVRWSPCFDTYLRYKVALVDRPFYGTKPLATANPNPPPDTIESPYRNTLLPEQDNRVEFGGTWIPADNLFVNATVGLENRRHTKFPETKADGRFDENLYPWSLSVWYVPNCKWTFSAGYASFSDFLEEDITLGDNYEEGLVGHTPFANPIKGAWAYHSRADVFTLGATYAYTERVMLSAEAEYVTGIDRFDEGVLDYGTTPVVFTPSIGSYSAVVVNTTRLNVGLDYLFAPRMNAYLRYVLFNYNDATKPLNTGTAHMILGGVSALF